MLITAQALIFALGILHAAAAYFYFSKGRGAITWSAIWVFFSTVCAGFLGWSPWLIAGVFLVAIASWTGWWISIPALSHRHWIPEDMQQATGEITEDRLTVHNVRNFAWQGPHEFISRWENRVYNLNALNAIDLFVCTWGDPNIAHLIVSFVFDDVPPLAFSIETRRETTEKWSILAGFMKSYELIVIAADERDVIRVRTNVRHETVGRYRLALTPQMRRTLLAQYLNEINNIAARPRFYNTLFRNCTTEVTRILHVAGKPLPLNWRLVISGHVPEYLYRHGLIATHSAFDIYTAGADVGTRARAADAFPDFSNLIRQTQRPSAT